jgi:hypothetical protein
MFNIAFVIVIVLPSSSFLLYPLLLLIHGLYVLLRLPYNVGFEVVTEVVMKSSVFWDISVTS